MVQRVYRDTLEAHTTGALVAAEEPLASWSGAAILASGGNAVDAAVAVSLSLSVVIPHLGGIGGDFFALVRTPEGRVYFFNGSGYAPAGLTRDLLLSKGYSQVPGRGPLYPTVPGMVDGLHLMWRRLGSLEWRELVEPAANLASRGFPASPSYVKALKALTSDLSRDPGSRETYLASGIPSVGDTIRFPGLARLLEMIAGDPRSFYEGEPARRLEEYLQAKGGVLAVSDLAAYKAEEGEPISASFGEWRLWEMPPNTQGLTTLHLIKILEADSIPRDTLARLPLMLAASKAAYRVRDEMLGDPRFMKHSIEELLSDEFIQALREEARRYGQHGLAQDPGASGDTTFFIVVDREGMLVAGIQSLFYPFGSMVTEPVFQVTLNGRAQGFTLKEGLPNTLEPGKKPLHTLSALIAERGDEVVALGASGGHFRPQQHALLFTSIAVHGMSVGEAISAPRALWAPWTDRIVVDPGFEAMVQAPPGYRVEPGRTGVAAAVHLKRGVRTAATDPRGDGYPLILH